MSRFGVRKARTAPKRSDGKSWRFVTTGNDGSGIVRLMRFFFGAALVDMPIDSRRRGKKSTLVGDDMVVVVSAAASWGSGTVKGGTQLGGTAAEE